MKRIIMVVSLLVSLAPAVGAAQASVDVRIDVGLPVSPPLVVVQPGIQVVENYDEEVFFTRGWYWARRGPYWYRARRPGAPFVRVERRHVPAGLVRIPPGQYRHWHRAEATEAHREMKRERKEWKQRGRGEQDHGHDHGHHDG